MANEEDNDSFSLISLILRLGAWYTMDITQVEKKTHCELRHLTSQIRIQNKIRLGLQDSFTLKQKKQLFHKHSTTQHDDSAIEMKTEKEKEQGNTSRALGTVFHKMKKCTTKE